VSGRGLPRPGARALCATLLLPLVLVLMTVGTASSIQWPWLRGDDRPPVYPAVTATPSWLAERLGDSSVVVVDARSAAEYSAGHIPGAISVPPSALGLDDRIDPFEMGPSLGQLGLTGRGRIVCCGVGRLDGAAAVLFWALDVAGAESPMLLEGGFEVWAAGGHPKETTASKRPPATWTASPRPDRVASAAYVALVFGTDGHEIIDTRGWDEWAGELDEGSWGTRARVGHIPHALPYDFSEFRSADETSLPPDETREIFSRTGPRPSTPVDLGDEFIVHGRGGTDGATGYYLLRRAGIERLRYFQAGWSLWKSDHSLPVVRIVSPDELAHRVAGERRWLRPDAPPRSFVLFDVRHWGDHATGHIPGAVGLSSSFFADSLDVYIARDWPDIDRSSTPVVTYCYGSNCIRSRNTATQAARSGFTYVERFYRGIEGWRLVGGELLRDEERLEAMRREYEKVRREAEAKREARDQGTAQPTDEGG